MVEVDAYIGEIVAALDAAGVLDNTFIFVTSDNGPQLDSWPDSGYTPFRGAKGSAWEGGVRVPGIAYWRGMIAPGRESDELFDLMDLFNTSLSLAGIADRLPTDRYIDGIDQTSFLLADDGRSNREKVYIWNEADLMAMRMYEYKIHVKVVETHAQWLNIDMTTVVGRRPRAVALQPLHRPEGGVPGRPPDERLPRLDGGRDEGPRRDLQEVSAQGHRARAVAGRFSMTTTFRAILLASAVAVAAPALAQDAPVRRLGPAVSAGADGGRGGAAAAGFDDDLAAGAAASARRRAERADRAARRRRLRRLRDLRRRGAHPDPRPAGAGGHRLQPRSTPPRSARRRAPRC